MADTLLYVFEDVLNSNKLDATLSKQDLAELSGMARDSAIKVLRNFQNAGIIRFNDHEIELLDLAALQRISRTG
jgi:CRP-like cAMP-binding protein